MATAGLEQVTEDAIRTVARSCGSLSIECSDVAGYVSDVSERIGAHLKTLDGLEEVTTRLLADQARVSDSTDEARLLSEQAKAKLEAGREAIEQTIAGFKGGLCRCYEPGPERVFDHRGDRAQDQHAGA
jgi:methyl-accepting chemotaxis protein